jgi:hypothetical protein
MIVGAKTTARFFGVIYIKLAKLRLVLGRGLIPGFPCSSEPRGLDGRSRILNSLDVFVVVD